MTPKDMWHMANSDLYRVGIGMFGGRTGTYGRYGIGPRVSGLSPQFNKSSNVEERQMRRFGRKKESGYTGEGYWYSNYPNMIGTMGSGSYSVGQPQPEKPKSKLKRTASSGDAMGFGGVTFNGGGAIS